MPYGVIGLGPDGTAQTYNATESALAGLPKSRVLGVHFFDHIAQCMNNFMVAQRFEDEPELDATIDFVLTLRMRPTPVKLRLLQSLPITRHYILVERTVSAGRA
nr:phosphonate transporter [Polymorphobacter multimanifer]